MRAAPTCSRLNGMSLPWPVQSVVAGAAGTTTMTLAYATERRRREKRRGPLDAELLAASVGTHAAYVTAVAVVDDAVRRGPINLGGS